MDAGHARRRGPRLFGIAERNGERCIQRLPQAGERIAPETAVVGHTRGDHRMRELHQQRASAAEQKSSLGVHAPCHRARGEEPGIAGTSRRWCAREAADHRANARPGSQRSAGEVQGGGRARGVRLPEPAHRLIGREHFDADAKLPEASKRVSLRTQLSCCSGSHDQVLGKLVEHVREILQHEPVPILPSPVPDKSAGEDDHVVGELLPVDGHVTEAVSSIVGMRLLYRFVAVHPGA